MRGNCNLLGFRGRASTPPPDPPLQSWIRVALRCGRTKRDTRLRIVNCAGIVLRRSSPHVFSHRLTRRLLRLKDVLWWWELLGRCSPPARPVHIRDVAVKSSRTSRCALHSQVHVNREKTGCKRYPRIQCGTLFTSTALLTRFFHVHLDGPYSAMRLICRRPSGSNVSAPSVKRERRCGPRVRDQTCGARLIRET